MRTNTGLSFEQITGNIGSEVLRIDLSEPLTNEVAAELRAALLDRVLLVFQDQEMDQQDVLRFGTSFGPLVTPAFQTNHDPSAPPELIVIDQTGAGGAGNEVFHMGSSFLAVPPMGLILHGVQIPPSGGDTVFSSLYAAYDALSASTKGFLEGLQAEHSIAPLTELTKNLGYVAKRGDIDEFPAVMHPIVRVHPESGRKLLNTNRHYTVSIPDPTKPEQSALLEFLFQHIENVAFQCRLRWREGTVAIVDDRAAVHRVVEDFEERRVLNRVMVQDASRPLVRASA